VTTPGFMPRAVEGDDWVSRRMQHLQRQIDQLAAARSADATQIGAGGITITAGGSVRIVDTSGTTIAIIGTLPSPFYDRADGSAQSGIIYYREDGSTAMVLGDGNATVPPFQQSLQIYDRGGATIVADDTNSGQGLARPYLTFGAFADNTAPTLTTTSATFATIQTLIGYKQHPNITAQILCRSSDGTTTGEARLVDQGGTQVGATVTIPASDFTYHTISPAAVAGAHLAQISLNLQIRRTAGSGTIGARGVSAIGVQT
jgi:hypothetical protein